MEITPKQQRNLYAIFIGVFVFNAVITAWNVREAHKLRLLQTKLSSEQLDEINRNKDLTTS